MIKKILSNKCNMLFFGINLVVIIKLLYQYSILDSIYLIGVDTLLIIYIIKNKYIEIISKE